jgi:hypothetical protein
VFAKVDRGIVAEALPEESRSPPTFAGIAAKDKAAARLVLLKKAVAPQCRPGASLGELNSAAHAQTGFKEVGVTEGDEPRRFRVKLARPVFETTVMDVRAQNHEQAIEMATRAATSVPDAEWVGTFEPENYGYSIEIVLDSRDVEAETSGEELDEDPMDISFAAEDTRYVVLQADVAVGEGELPLPPWIKRESALLIRDVVADWVVLLEESANQLVAARQLQDEIDHETIDDDPTPPTEGSEVIAQIRVRTRDTTDAGKAESEQPGAEHAPVVSLSEHRARRRGNDQYPAIRAYRVTIKVLEGGITGFSFNGVELSAENIGDVTDDVQFIADCLRDDRSDFLGDQS